MRKDLGVYQKHIEDLELLDYRVRVFQGGTDAVTRVLIEFGDGTGDTWSTVGVSGNIIDASFQALVDAITYRLVKLGVAGAVSVASGVENQASVFDERDVAAVASAGCSSITHGRNPSCRSSHWSRP